MHISRWVGIPLLAGLLACAPAPEGRPAAPEKEAHREEAADIRVEPVRSATWQVPVKTVGEVGLNAERAASITARASGWVDEVLAFPEDKVREGQVLARIHSPDYLTAQIEFFLAEDRLRRAGGDPEELRVAAAVLEASKGRLRLLGVSEERIEVLHREHDERHAVSPLIEIRAPLGGTVIESALSKGKAVSPGEALARIADLSRLWVLVDVYEQDLARVSEGAPVRVIAPAFPGQVFPGRVVLLSGIQQEKTRTVKARVAVENTQGRLRPGTFVEAELSGAGSQVLAVPEDAVVIQEGKPTVFVQSGKTYEPRPVETGRRLDGRVEILKGLREGDPVVVAGASRLTAGLLREKPTGGELPEGKGG